MSRNTHGLGFRGLVLACAACLLTLAAGQWSQARAEEPPTAGRVLSVSGLAEAQQGTLLRRLEVGDALLPDDTLLTRDNAALTCALADGSTLSLGAFSALTLEPCPTGGVALTLGPGSFRLQAAGPGLLGSCPLRTPLGSLQGGAGVLGSVIAPGGGHSAAELLAQFPYVRNVPELLDMVQEGAFFTEQHAPLPPTGLPGLRFMGPDNTATAIPAGSTLLATAEGARLQQGMPQELGQAMAGLTPPPALSARPAPRPQDPPRSSNPLDELMRSGSER